MGDQDRRVPRRQAYDCGHANEVPAQCPCDADCYCRMNTCQWRSASPSGSKDSNPKDHAATTKLPLWLLSPAAKAWWSLGQLAGLVKYGAWNWRKAGVRASVYISAIERHLEKFKAGERLSADDKVHHLGHVMACAAIMLDAEACGKLVDDRPPSYSLEECFEECERTAQHLFDVHAGKNPRHYTIHDTQECFGETKKP